MRTIEKRGQITEEFDKEKMHKNIATICRDLKAVNVDLIVDTVLKFLPSDLTTEKLSDLIADTMRDLQSVHPEYEKAAVLYYLQRIYKTTPNTFSEACFLAFSNDILNKTHYEFIMDNRLRLNAMIDTARDKLFSHLGITILIRQRYLIHSRANKLIDRPQYLFMRVAIGIWATGKEENKLDLIQEYYNLFSEQYYTHATPSLYNACQCQQFSSCFLLQVKDSLEGIMRGATQSSIISKYSGGVGYGYSSVRGVNSHIKSVNGTTKGIVNQLSIFNECAICWDQGGKRKGAFVVYLEVHHIDIFDFIEMRDTSRSNAKLNLNTALWVCNLFIERVVANGKWSLFSPDTAPGLDDVYGDEYKKLYERYEREGRAAKIIPAQELFNKIAYSISKTSSPYICFKDHVNEKSNQKNIGTIKCSNLCTEIMEWSSPDSVASCTLCSISLKKFITNGKFDFEKLRKLTRMCVRALDRIIDINSYPIPECIDNAQKYRPIGIGVQGLADLFCELRIPYDSEEAAMLDKQIFETIYFGALQESVNLAKEYGTYSAFHGSPASQGILQYHMWGVKPTDLWNWTGLLKDIMTHGLRNSLLLAAMPTVSTSKILGNCDSFEPFFSNVINISGISGKNTFFNKYLLTHLIELGLWNEDMQKELILRDGDIQNIETIPREVRNIYKTVFNIKQSYLIVRNAARSAFVDQACSFNIFSEDNTPNAIKAIILKTHGVGLKTGIYYFHAKTASHAIKNIVKSEKKIECTDEVCTVCSS